MFDIQNIVSPEYVINISYLNLSLSLIISNFNMSLLKTFSKNFTSCFSSLYNSEIYFDLNAYVCVYFLQQCKISKVQQEYFKFDHFFYLIS